MKRIDQGLSFYYKDIPDKYIILSNKWRKRLLESAIEESEELMDKYFSGQKLNEIEIKNGLRKRVLKNDIVLVICGSAFKNKGIQALLDAVVDFLPSPSDIFSTKSILNNNGVYIERLPKDNEPFSAIAFKIISDRSICW